MFEENISMVCLQVLAISIGFRYGAFYLKFYSCALWGHDKLTVALKTINAWMNFHLGHYHGLPSQWF